MKMMSVIGSLLRSRLLSSLLAIALVVLPATMSFAQGGEPGQILGVWESESRDLKLEMYQTGGAYAGRVLYGDRLVEADGKTWKPDTKNPNPALRARSLNGVDFVTGLKWNAAERRWTGGVLYDPSAGRTYNANVTLNGAWLELRGYLGTPVLGRTVRMRRVDH